MRIPMNINNKSVYADCDPDEPLAAVLRTLKFLSVKCGCTKGLCGCCTVLIRDKPTPSCLVPVAAVKEQHITTLEYFMQTDDYTDIDSAFRQAGIHLCGFCDAGRIFAVHEIIELHSRPDKTLITERLRTFSCPCTDDDRLMQAVFIAADMRRKRLGSIKYGLR